MICRQLVSVVMLTATLLNLLDAMYIVCQPRTRRDLLTKLEKFGGYQKRYQAITVQEAENFPLLVHQKSTVSTTNDRMGSQLFRNKRQTSTYPQTNYTRTVKRGSLDRDNNLYYLCTERSAVTTLSADYFPRHLNEVICDKTDNLCLYGNQGECVQESFDVKVLKKTGQCGADGKEKWDLVSQKVRSSCNCRAFLKTVTWNKQTNKKNVNLIYLYYLLP